MAECRKDDTGFEILSRAVSGWDVPIHWLSRGKTLRECIAIIEPANAPDGARAIVVVKTELEILANLKDNSVTRVRDTPEELIGVFREAGLTPPPVASQDPADAA